MRVINNKGQDFTLNLDPTLSGSFPVFLSLTRGWRMTTWLHQEHGMTVSLTQPSHVGYLKFRFPNIRFKLFILGFVLLYIFYVHMFFVLQWTLSFWSFRGCLVCVFKQLFLVFKQHFTYFNTLFHPHVFLQIFLNKNF